MLEYLDSIFSYAMILTDNESQAEDLVLKAYLFSKKVERHMEGQESVKALLLRILRGIWFDDSHRQSTSSHTSNTRVNHNAVDEVIRTSSTLNSPNRSQLEPQLLRQVIQHLPVNYREVIFLREYEGLSYHEITMLLDCSTDTVRSHLADARRKLRLLLAVAKNRR
jgi:RNA polymerase sigma-70 factor (ECF subfamily)